MRCRFKVWGKPQSVEAMNHIHEPSQALGHLWAVDWSWSTGQRRVFRHRAYKVVREGRPPLVPVVIQRFASTKAVMETANKESRAVAWLI